MNCPFCKKKLINEDIIVSVYNNLYFNEKVVYFKYSPYVILHIHQNCWWKMAGKDFFNKFKNE